MRCWNIILRQNISVPRHRFLCKINGWKGITKKFSGGGVRAHNAYSQEKLEQDCIRSGDVEGLKHALDIPLGGKLGILAKDLVRSKKNLSIVVVAISTRSALEGGVSSEAAYALSDSYIRQIEAETNMANLLLIVRSAQMAFTRLVKAHKDGKKTFHPLVDKCLNLIFENIHNKITVAELAEQLNVNPNYLSKLFHEKMGITIMDYCKTQKVQLAKNQLVYTNCSPKEIAYSLGFASQSHFGKVFKEITGMTPGNYQKRYETGGENKKY